MHYFEHVPEIQDIFSLHPGAKACLFDMDGTLMNTEVLHAKAMFELLKNDHPGAFTLERLHELCLGKTDEHVFESLRKENFLSHLAPAELENKKITVFLALLKTTLPGSIFFPEVKSLLDEMEKARLKLALVTSSDRRSAEALLQLLEIDRYFELVITKESTERNKPHPEPYLKALEHFGMDPKDCVIFEDSPTGLEAAKSSGARTIIHARWY